MYQGFTAALMGLRRAIHCCWCFTRLRLVAPPLWQFLTELLDLEVKKLDNKATVPGAIKPSAQPSSISLSKLGQLGVYINYRHR